MTLTQHPLSAAFPRMPDAEFQILYDSIEALGVQNPITLLNGQVLDGWHRYTAAQGLGMKCPTVDLAEWIEPVQFVRAQNQARRHLPLSAWALIEVSLREWKPAHRPDKGALSAPLMSTNQEMADAVGSGLRTIKQAKTVHAQAVPEVQDAVKRGEIGLPKAVAIAKLPQAEQAAAIRQPIPKKPAPAPVVEPETEAPPEYTAMDALRDECNELRIHVQEAEAAMAIKNMEGTEEEKQQAAAIIAEQRAEIQSLRINYEAVILSRDSLMEERVQMLRQLKAQRNEIDRLKAGK